MAEKRQLMGPRPPRDTPEYAQYQKAWAEYKQGPEYAEYLRDREQRRAASGTGGGAVEEPTAELLAMSVEELNALSDDLDRQRAALMVKKRQVAAARARLLAEEQADEWALSPDDYQQIKAWAKEEGVPLHAALNAARRARRKGERQAQTATASVAATRTQARGT